MIQDIYKHNGYAIRLISNGGIACYRVWLGGHHYKFDTIEMAKRAIDQERGTK